MARKVKLWEAAAAVAVLIFLSGTTNSLECYWCGPLAEQVHRSQRAPPCDPPQNHSTVCDPGYTHCAVVATSPPFVESRYCVKFYQDECYTLYCNSTKTFRTICPCQGEMCNGPNTQRETEAFATLQKTVVKAQNARIKKRDTSQEPDEVKIKDEVENVVSFNKTEINYSSNMIENDVDELKTSEIPNADDTQADQPGETIQSDQPVEDIQSDQPVEENENNKPQTTTVEQVTKSTDSLGDSVEKHNIETTTESPNEPMTNHVEQNNVKVSTAETLIQTVTETFTNVEIKPSIQLPTAEALQQNSDQAITSEKTTESTLYEPTLTSTLENQMITTLKPEDQKNNAIGRYISNFMLLKCLILHL